MSDKYIEVFKKDSVEYDRLQSFADRVNAMHTGNVTLSVQDCYFDASQNWMWTTLIAHDNTRPPKSSMSSWQALQPGDQEAILTQNDKKMSVLADALAAKYGARK